DPLRPERERLPLLSRTTPSEEDETADHLSFDYIRRTDDSRLIYKVETSFNLMDWGAFEGIEQVLGEIDENAERVRIIGAAPVDQSERRFIRVRVDRLN